MVIKEMIGERINDAAGASKILQAILAMEDEIDKDKEHMWVIGLNAKNAIKFIELVSLGTLTNSLMHPRETFRLSIRNGIASIIIGHNHPSGDPEPSQDDINVTRRLKETGEIIGIRVLDHVIVGEREKYVSLKERGIL